MIVRDPRLVKRVVETLAYEHALTVLLGVSDRESTVPKLVEQYRIPSSTAYRLISELEGVGLLAKVRSDISPDGKKFDVYRLLVSRLTIGFESSCWMEIVPREDAATRFLRLWGVIGGQDNV